jgi:hypothetical protein
MAVLHGKYGKDHVAKGSEGYISEALFGGHGPSDEIVNKSIGHGQTLKSAYALDNVTEICDIPTSLKEGHGVPFRGGENNITHSLRGASVINDDMLADGKVKHQFEKGI